MASNKKSPNLGLFSIQGIIYFHASKAGMKRPLLANDYFLASRAMFGIY